MIANLRVLTRALAVSFGIRSARECGVMQQPGITTSNWCISSEISRMVIFARGRSHQIRVKSIRFRPRFGLKANVTSGDRDPQSQTLGTFNALFPKGAYFSEADLIGPYNHMDLHPSVEFQLTKKLTLTPDVDVFWRQSTRDGIYSTPGVLLRSGKTSTARYVGTHANVQLDWRVNRHVSFTAIYLHFFPGQFLKDTQPAFPVNFVTA
jgi:hypothetical protein